MIPSEEERKFRPCKSCSRYLSDKNGPEKCLLQMIGPYQEGKGESFMRDFFSDTELLDWPCPDHLTHEEFKKSFNCH